MSYELDLSKYVGEPKHCCHSMDLALDEGYLDPTITFSGKVYPPRIAGQKLTERGRKRKPNLIVNFCPWCGKRLAEPDEPAREDEATRAV